MRASPVAPLVLFVVVALAQGRAKPDTAAGAADKVLAAVAAKNDAALKALAARDLPDPWVVADELCTRGEHDAAARFAGAALRLDTEKLAAYVALRRKSPTPTRLRDGYELAKRTYRGDPRKGLAILDGLPRQDDSVVGIRADCVRANVLWNMGKPAEGEKLFLAAAELADRIGWTARVSATLREAAYCARRHGDAEGAIAHGVRRLDLDQRRGDRAGVAAALIDMGRDYVKIGDQDRAVELVEQGLREARAIGHRRWAAHANGILGTIYRDRGDYDRAFRAYGESLTTLREVGDALGVIAGLGNLGEIHHRRAEYAQALVRYEQARRVAEQTGHDVHRGRILHALGMTHSSRGDYTRALASLTQAAQIAESTGDRPGLAIVLGGLGTVYLELGAYAKALSCFERGLRLAEQTSDRRRMAIALVNIAHSHLRFGAHDRALACAERGLKIQESLSDRSDIAAGLETLAAIHQTMGHHEKALELHQRALIIGEELGDRARVATILSNIGDVHDRMGDLDKRLEYEQRALELRRELGQRADVAKLLNRIAGTHAQLRRLEEALDYNRRGLEEANKIGSRRIVIRALWNLAAIQLMRGDPGAAVRAARAGVEQLPRLVEGLDEERGAAARDGWVGILDTGVRAGVQLKDAGEVWYFMESGRAGALLESLGNRAALRDVGVPADLGRAEIEACDAVALARARYDEARRKGERKSLQPLRDALDAAQQNLADVRARIQRAAKAAADLVYPKAAPLEDVQGTLADGDALVLYAVLDKDAVALVVTRENARIVSIGTRDEIRALLKRATANLSATIDALRQKVVAPLGLDKKTRRLLISPGGKLSYVPFSLLVGDREVAYVPSGTTYGVLRESDAMRGRGVLALGDPVYEQDGAKPNPIRSEALTRLPGTRGEVQKIGDRTLLGAEATKAQLRAALLPDKRWRAVHFACHGLIDPARPMLSSLALTPDGKDDGFLTTMDILRMRIPADLVVLSACGTALGKVHRAEGVIGFTRAFMMAGAPRVICSLWKVDDEATRALMVKFYELWNPKDGSKGLPTATALKKAQEFVASHEKWKRPYFWAAWQLWGLPD